MGQQSRTHQAKQFKRRALSTMCKADNTRVSKYTYGDVPVMDIAFYIALVSTILHF